MPDEPGRARPVRRARLDPPPAVREIAARLERAGFETWCVGGAVRDALLGHAHLDWDLATAATPDEVRGIFRRTVPIGVQFGTVGVLDRDGIMHEVTTFRRDVRTDGRHAEVEFGVSLDDDLARRDFTINAIAYSPSRDAVHDPFGGREDLARGIVRAVGEPDARMREDRLRALRAIRFAARFGFDIDPATWRAIEDSAPHLGRLSRERVKQELEKTMEQVARPGAALALWRSSGALRTLVPSLERQPPEALAALDCLALPRGAHGGRRRANRVAALFVGLPGTEPARAAKDLRFSNAEVSWIAALADRWTALYAPVTAVMQETMPPDDATVRQWAAAAGRTRLADLVRLMAARWEATPALRDAIAPARVRSVYRRAVRIAWRDPIELGDLALDGEDLQREGFAPGPGLGKILRALLDAVVEDPSRNSRETLLALARAHAAEGA